VWEYRARRGEEAAVFDAAMRSLSHGIGEAVAAAYDFGRCRLIVDVGGGRGGLIACLLRTYDAARGILFDLPHVTAHADDALRAAGVASRCEVIAGSFFDGVPAGGDAYVLKAVLHDWDDEPASRILRACRHAMRPGGRVLVIERLIAPPNEGPEAKFSDLNMLVAPGGKERTSEEFARLFVRAGLRLAEVVATGTRLSIIEAIADDGAPTSDSPPPQSAFPNKDPGRKIQ
jgi:SAM-dependent methyltransferase